MSPLVTVVTPTYNMADRLPRCVASVANQTWGDVEHIVVDGGSTDATVTYLETLSDVRWVSEKDGGQSDALNKGFAMANGELFTWLNADDVLSPVAAELAAKALHADPSIGLVYGDLEVVSASGRRIVKPPSKVTLTSFRRGNVISQPGTFFTARAFHAVGGIDESFHLAMDFDLWLRMLMAGVSARYVPKALASFEVHVGSKTGSQGTLAFAQEEERAFLKHGRYHEAAMTIDRWFWDDTVHRIVRALEAGDPARARSIATGNLPSLHPVISRIRAFLWLSRLSPALARLAIPLKRHRQPEPER